MADATDFLTAWTLERSDRRALTHGEAQMVAGQWEADAEANGIDRNSLSAAAGGDLAAYLLRTFGEEGQEMSTDAGDHSGGSPPRPDREDDDRIRLF